MILVLELSRDCLSSLAGSLAESSVGAGCLRRFNMILFANDEMCHDICMSRGSADRAVKIILASYLVCCFRGWIDDRVTN